MPHRKVVFCSSPFVLLDANVYQYNLLSLGAWVEGISLTFVKFCGKLQHAEKYSFDIITIHWSARGKRNIPMNGTILHSGCREERPSQAKTLVKKRNRLNPRKRNYAQQLLGHCNLKLNLPKLKPNSCKAKKDSRSCAKYHVKKKNRFCKHDTRKIGKRIRSQMTKMISRCYSNRSALIYPQRMMMMSEWSKARRNTEICTGNHVRSTCCPYRASMNERISQAIIMLSFWV